NLIFQYFTTTAAAGPTNEVVEAWVFAESDQVGVGIDNGGSTALRASTTGQSRWELLRATSGEDPATEVVIASKAVDTCFYVDSVSTQP
ncbi:MAG TPA: hypothetical protein VNO31_39690, partial [Umezawaea sp.]|nr:hypothetical protein [Umezawaea sp.]